MKRTLLAAFLVAMLSACDAPRDDISTQVAPVQIAVPSMAVKAVVPPHVAFGVAFRTPNDMIAPQASGTPATGTVPNIAPGPPGSLPSGSRRVPISIMPAAPPIFVIGISEGARPSAAVLGWTKPFVYVGDTLGGSRVTRIDMDGVTLETGDQIRVTSAMANVLSPPAEDRASNLIVPNIAPAIAPPIPASATGNVGVPNAAPTAQPSVFARPTGARQLTPTIPNQSAPQYGASPIPTGETRFPQPVIRP